ncbi:MAG: NUDIX domain-containing protein [Solirubrobacteraceae bacterium]
MDSFVRADSGPAAIVAAVLVRDGRVLLCLRSPQRRWSPCLWDLPGGHVERGESDPIALARELGEELGVTVAPAAIAATRPEVRIIDHEVDMRVWVVRDWSGDAVNAAPDEHDAVGWFEPAQLEHLSLAHPEYRGLLRRVGRGSQPSAAAGT